MAQCNCNGCGGYAEWKRQQALEMVAKRERFEQWLAARDAANEAIERSIHDEEVAAFRERTVAA